MFRMLRFLSSATVIRGGLGLLGIVALAWALQRDVRSPNFLRAQTGSPDVSSWTAVADMKFGTSPLQSVTYGDGKYVAVGYDGKGAYSLDGVTWTAISDMKFSTIHAVTYGAGKFVAVGDSASVRGAYSADGITWTAIGDMKSSHPLYDVTYGNGKFVAVSYSGKGATSADGITWTAINDMTFEYKKIYAVTYGNGKFMAVGDGGKGAYSTDGVTWTAVSDMKFGGLPIVGVAYNNGTFVAAGASGKGAYSLDGITWTAINDMKFGSGNSIYSVVCGNGMCVAVGFNGKGAYSLDGITWTAIDDMKFGNDQINAVTYGNGKFVAVGNSGKGSYSGPPVSVSSSSMGIVPLRFSFSAPTFSTDAQGNMLYTTIALITNDNTQSVGNIWFQFFDRSATFLTAQSSPPCGDLSQGASVCPAGANGTTGLMMSAGSTRTFTLPFRVTQCGQHTLQGWSYIGATGEANNSITFSL
ncbi:MAG: hypothetical protein V1876_01135, partial [Candidatus Peregrinibacteria bacterium]